MNIFPTEMFPIREELIQQIGSFEKRTATHNDTTRNKRRSKLNNSIKYLSQTMTEDLLG